MNENVQKALEAKMAAKRESYLRNEAVGRGVCPDCAGNLAAVKQPGFFQRMRYNARTEMLCASCGRSHVYTLPTIYGL